jgi:Uma2 family endonuclease
MVAMTVARTDLPSDRPLTTDDLCMLPDDGNRYELDNGVLVVTPSPTFGHQRVAHRLAVALDAACPADFEVLPGSGVQISRIQYRIADIIVIRAGTVGSTDNSATEPPVLAIEVASPSTASYDLSRKKDVYARFGIESYWIVTPDTEMPSLMAFELRRGSRYHLLTEARADDVFQATRPFACGIVPAALVAGPWRR